MFDLVKELEDKSIKVSLKNNNLQINFDGEIDDELLNKLKANKEKLINFLAKHSNADKGIKSMGLQQSYPISHAQKRLWIQSQIEENSKAYHICNQVELNGDYDIHILETAVLNVVKRHEILRTVFKLNDEGEIRQWILSDEDLKLKIDHIDFREEKDGYKKVSKYILDDNDIVFDLENGPLLRIAFLRLTNDQYVFYYNMHHIITDGWSLNILERDLFAYYESVKSGVKCTLEDLPIQYKDYASWQLSAIETGTYNQHKDFWTTHLSGDLPRLDLPSLKTRPKVMTYNGHVLKTYLSPEQTTKLKDFSKQNGGSLFMTLLSVLKILLNKYTSQQDIILGTAVAGREDSDLENQIGFYVNTLTLRTAVNPEDSYAAFFENVKKSTLEAFSHQIYPFDILISDLNLVWDVSRNSLFDIMVTFHNIIDGRNALEIDKDSFNTIIDSGLRKSNFDLDFEFQEVGNSLMFITTYNEDVYEYEMIEQLIHHFKRIINEVLEYPDKAIKDIDYLSVEEKKQLLFDFNDTSIAYPKHKTIIDLFEEQVANTPNVVAVVFENKELTYKELNEQANQLGHYLRKNYNIQPDDLISIKQERSDKMLISILGILKSGAAYVPIDPAYPKERIEYIEQNSNSKLVLDEKEFESFFSQKKEYSLLNPEKNNTSDNLAYVIYTSGSTGNPKGVMIEHKSVVNFLFGMTKSIDLDDEDKLLAITSISFDISVLELFWTLTNGTTIRINKNHAIGDFDRFVESRTKNLDFSIFYFSNDNDNVQNKYGLVKETVQYADENGYTAVWFPERHFHEFGGIFPNPSLLGAAFANSTKNIEIRSGSVVLPLHDVVRVAEEWSVVDNLSNGRVALSIASGWHPDDFIFKPENYLEKQKIMYSQIDELKKIWKGGTFKRKNGLNEEVELQIYPKPINPDLKIYITSGGNAETFRSAGKIGANILTHLLGQEVSELKKNIAIYKQSLLENEFSVDEAKISLMIHTFIGNDINEVEKIVKTPFKQYLKTSAGLIKNIAKDLDKEILGEQDIETILDIAFERYWKTTALLGTEESCMGLLNEIYNIGVTEVACLIDFGINENIIIENLKNLTRLKSYFTKNKNENAKSSFSSIQITPSYLEALLDDTNSAEFIKSLKNIIVGGENFTTDLLNKIRLKSHAAIYNMYGPTETTIWSTFQKVSENIKLNIGKPIQNTQVYILDDHKRLCPLGVKGELYIGGDGLSRGYYKQEELTNDKFITLDFIDKNKKFYRTGDVAKWLPNGTLDFLGRNDSQIKLNGFRIELGEIEQIISNQDLISQSVVVVKEKGNDKFMVAYFVSKNNIDKKVLQDNLSKVLPDYMLPRYYVQLDSIPLTPNGKADRKALPAVDEKDLIKDLYVAPRTKEEELIVAVWSEVLRYDKISVKDSFYNLGGDSIKSIRIVSLLKQRGYTVKVEQVLRNPIVEDLAKLVENNTVIIDQSEVIGAVELTPIQYYFFESEVLSNKNHHNQSLLLKSKSLIDPTILNNSIAALVAHHDALRMVYKFENGIWSQYNDDTSGMHYKINFYDLRNESDELASLDRIGDELQSSFDISSGVLFHIGHFRMSDGDRLGLIIHHLVVDGVSWRILLEDFSNIYQSLEKGSVHKLPLKTNSYKDWAASLKEYAKSKKMQLERLYWEQVSKEEIKQLPIDNASVDNVSIKDKTSHLILDSSLTQKLLTQIHDVYKTEINDLLLTGLALAIKETFGTDKSIIKMEGHGREEIIDGIDIGNTIGWFTSVYPFVLDISDSNGHELVVVKEALRKIPNKGIGYGILNYLDKRFLNKLKPSIEFNYLGDFGDSVGGNKEESLFEFSSERIGSPTNKQTEELLYVSGMIVSGELRMSIQYSTLLFNEITIEKLITSYKQKLINLVVELSEVKQNQLTPSDLTYKNISYKELLEIDVDKNVQDIYELSPLQQGFYYYWLVDKSSHTYFNQATYRLYSEHFDIKKIEEAYSYLIDRHAVLRTSFVNNYSTVPLQIVHEKGIINFSYEKIDDNSSIDDCLLSIKEKDKSTGFDFAKPTQMRLKIVDLGKGYYEFIWSYHHILMDGWCLNILINDFNSIVTSIVKNETIALPEPAKYSEYLKWLSKLDKTLSADYWKQYLSDFDTVSDIPFKNKKQKAAQFKIGYESCKIEGELYQNVIKICQQIQITPNIFMQGVWGYLLSRYNNTQDIVFGSVVSGRPAELSEAERMIGLFINTIPVRVKYTNDDTPLSMLKKMHLEAIESTPHHYLNLSDVQAQSILGTELIKTLFVYENYFVEENKDVNADISPERQKKSIELFEQTNYDFNVIIVPSSSSLKIDFQYDLDLFDPGFIKNLVSHFFNIVNEFAVKNNNNLNKMEYLTSAEKQQLLFDFNNTDIVYPKDKTIVDLFNEQVNKTPDNIAVVFNETKLTYRELNDQSNQLAAYLIENYGIESNDLVGIKLERSERMIVAIFGILKSGGAYVPIDANYPQDRIDYITKDANLKLCIDENELDKFRLNQDSYAKTTIQLSNLNDLAYCIYTSGSTGKPKGVLNHHAGLYNRLVWMKAYLDVDDKEVFLQKTPYTFDVSVWELILPFITGSSLVIAKPDGHKDVIYLQEVIDKEHVTIIHFVPSMLGSFLENVEKEKANSLLHIVCSGEELTVATAQQCKERFLAAELHNLYGPTEAAIDVTAINLTQVEVSKEGVSIGKPIANTKIYIVDNALELQAFGVPGELVISGIQVARGYLNLPELTEDRFIADPFRDGYHVYRTGDVAQWQPDGSIAYLGRIDNQVKIRGNRIELGEVENAITTFKNVQQVVVMAKELNSEKVLVAYVVSSDVLDKTELRKFLQDRLPDYMVPGFYIQLPELPLSSNGKIDRKALPDVSGNDIIRKEYVSAQNEIEVKLVLIWQEVLGLENISVTDNFFDLGGNSLKFIRLSNSIERTFNKQLLFSELYKKPILADQARMIEDNQFDSAINKISKVEPASDYSITKAQERIWLASIDKNGSVAHNIAFTYKIEGEVIIDKLQQAYNLVLNRHEILRTSVFMDQNNQLRQLPLNLDEINFEIEVIDLKSENTTENDPKVKTIVENATQQYLEISKGKVLNATLILLSETTAILHQVLHHIAGDEWSLVVLINDLLTAYSDLISGAKSDVLAPLEIQYKDYAAWESNLLETDENLKAFWKQQFFKPLLNLELPVDYHKSNYGTEGNHYLLNIDKEQSAFLKTIKEKKQISNSVLFTSLIYILFYKYTGNKDFLIGFIFTQREGHMLDDQIGPYINILPVRLDYGTELSFSKLLEESKNHILDVISFGKLPTESIRENIHPKSSDKIQIVLNIMNNVDVPLPGLEENKELTFTSVTSGYKSSKFPISIYVYESETTFSVNFEYKTEMFKSSKIKQLGDLFKKILQEALHNSEKSISEMELSNDLNLPTINKLKR
jgi:natural product biosynthesis luciferase-like monooxygenase protein/amino acid adenylation domain-containing protein/non-ribosomal peptide synthase protein (TIGR01720 family)